MNLEETLEQHGIYTTQDRYMTAKGAGDEDILFTPALLEDLRKWGKWLLYVNDGVEE